MLFVKQACQYQQEELAKREGQIKTAIDMRATQNLSRQVRQSAGLGLTQTGPKNIFQPTRTSAGLNLLQSKNIGAHNKPIFSTVKPTQKPLLGNSGPMPTPDKSNFPYFSPKTKAGTRSMSNPSPSATVNSSI